MAYHYYIYYRVQPEHAEACAARTRELLAEVKKTTGIAGRMLKKRDEDDLWMEIYENVADDGEFEWQLAEAVSRLKIQELLQPHTTRHVECFHD